MTVCNHWILQDEEGNSKTEEGGGGVKHEKSPVVLLKKCIKASERVVINSLDLDDRLFDCIKMHT